MRIEERIKLFGLSQQIAERDLDAIEKQYQIDLRRDAESDENRDEEYYPQFEQRVRSEAAAMAKHYELFYCLEKSIRTLVKDKLEAWYGVNWWDQAVPESIREKAQNKSQQEIDYGFTPRSTEEIDYTTFGELGEIVRTNWDVFSDTFNSLKAFTKVMTNLNVLRGPIAHCSPLAEDEIVRLRLTLKDWFRLME